MEARLMANIKETPQYQIYLEVLEALRQNGYDIVGRNSWQSTIRRGSESYGLIFVVKAPFYPEDNAGCGCLVSIIPGIEDILKSIRGWSNYAAMQSAEEMIRNKRSRGKRGEFIWPDGSLVGGYTTDSFGFTYNAELANILRSII